VERKLQWNCVRSLQFFPKTGAAEYLRLLHEFGTKGMITLNVVDGTPEEAAAWVAFCRGRIGDERAIGTDANGTDWRTVDHWARKRHDLTGILEPVNVLYWELGNEIQVEPETSLAFIRKLREIDPGILVGIVSWTDEALAGDLGCEADFLITHIYTGLPRYDDHIMIWGGEPMGDDVTAEFAVPADGEYALAFTAMGEGITPHVVKENQPPRVAFKVDDRVLETATLSDQLRRFELRAELAAGMHRFTASFLNDYYVPGQMHDTNVRMGRHITVTDGPESFAFSIPQVGGDLQADLAKARKRVEDVVATARSVGPAMFVAITEYNRAEGACFDLEAALYAAEFQRMLTEMPTVRTAEVWEASASNFGITWTRTDLGIVRYRPLGLLYRMARGLHSAKVAAAAAEGDETLRVLATRAPDTDDLAIMVTNFAAEPREVVLEVDEIHHLRLREQRCIHSESLYDNNEGEEKITIQTERLAAEAGHVTLPGYSVSLITATFNKGE